MITNRTNGMAFIIRCLVLCVALYFILGVCRFFGVAIMSDPGIRPIQFLDWWWIDAVKALAGK